MMIYDNIRKTTFVLRNVLHAVEHYTDDVGPYASVRASCFVLACVCLYIFYQ